MKNYLSQPPKIHFIEWNSEYERMMTSALKKEFNVHTIYHVKKYFKSVHALLPGKRLKHWHRKFQITIKFRHVRENDIIICNGYSAFLMLDLLSLLKCKKILVLRDSVAALTSKRRRLKLLAHDENYLDRVTAVFDVIYSFDPEDCRKYGLCYVDQFLPFTRNNIAAWQSEPANTPSSCSCFYVGGYDDYRAELINDLTLVLRENHCQTDFYLVDDCTENPDYPDCCINQKISYQQNIEKLKRATVVLEINKPGQCGLTLRALEAMAFNKKLITNNGSIKEHAFYSPERVFIWGEDNPTTLARFISTAHQKVDIALLEKYCADGMLRTLVGSELT